MHAFITITAMIATFAAHVAMMVGLRPREDKRAGKDDKSGETP